MRALLVAIFAMTSCARPPRIGEVCTPGRSFEPFDKPRPVEHHAHGHGVLDSMVAWYQDHARAPTTSRSGCPFAPTCSVYARQALARYGPLGAFLVVDRLIVREHLFAPAYYPIQCVRSTTRLIDDVP